MSEREKCLARFEDARESGLKSVKFFFRPETVFEPEAIFKAINEIEDAIKSGRAVRHQGWTENEPAMFADLT